MDPPEEQFATLSLNERVLVTSNASKLVKELPGGSANEIISQIDNGDIAEIAPNMISIATCTKSSKKVGPTVPAKPFRKKQDSPESLTVENYTKQNMSSTIPILQRKHPVSTLHKTSTNNVTLDNPVVLEQQLEALTHHKRQLEKKGLFLQQPRKNEIPSTDVTGFPKLLANCQANDNYTSGVIYSNVRSTPDKLESSVSSLTLNPMSDNAKYSDEANSERYIAKRITDSKTMRYNDENADRNQLDSPIFRKQNEFYSNMVFEESKQDYIPPLSTELSIDANEATDEETPPPPSPVSSSYSELRRATDAFKKPYHNCYIKSHETNIRSKDIGENKDLNGSQPQTYINMSCSNDFNSYCSTLQSSSTYESIYEPIIPRPASQLSSHANYLNYVPYVNGPQLNTSESGGNISTIGSISTSGCNTPSFSSIEASSADDNSKSSCQQKESEVEALTDFLVHSLDTGSRVENFGTCFKCNERVLGENSGCTAMEQIYHIACFTCTQCKINLQGKPFYALDGKPFCEYDYLQTLEKCSVCMRPILERILRATGKPYHPQCFTCVICGKSLDGIPFTVDATNQNYCISDFHKKFAPRCCVCMEPIMPESGEDETVRVVALDRSFHFECYKCEDCGLLLSSEAEGRGCYPLDGHVLCKSCNAKRVQMLTNRMTTEL
ncbi:PREDICTED: uncharacterized protein LOC108357005 isoform X2 [Rhagoletis zephyria]|uniref:uncharacterized protein LOC108357005 isoform X2 n=1 Tax=Rhagoletis zephyria TaxID=28612 RepID=UPI00081165D8|nr:PREDICTED: uncharacterized protein LOC108357005 isoform X2 [Rhagoletis zephyria]XP_036334976.1 uncharacterized protein LOC118745584 isoform X2 [Rhagoletis pomonella]